MAAEWIIAIDGGATTGWAMRYLPSPLILSGTWQYRPKKRDSRGAKFNAFAAHLRGMIEEYPARSVVYEMPGRLKSQDAVLACYGYAAHVESVCDRMAVPCDHFSPNELKLYATGNGNADKERMLGEAISRFPEQEILDHNQADALLLLQFYLDPQRDAVFAERRAVNKLKQRNRNKKRKAA